MSWWVILVLVVLYFAALAVVLLFFAGAARLNERCDEGNTRVWKVRFDSDVDDEDLAA